MLAHMLARAESPIGGFGGLDGRLRAAMCPARSLDGGSMGKQSHGTTHHADTTVVCPSCGRKFIHPHHAGVAEDWGEFVGVQFRSKQDGRWVYYGFRSS